MWLSLQAGEKAAGTPGRWRSGDVWDAGGCGVIGTNDQAPSGLELVGDVDLVARGVFVKLDVGDGVANVDAGRGRGMEEAAGGGGRGGEVECARETAGGKHCGRW